MIRTYNKAMRINRDGQYIGETYKTITVNTDTKTATYDRKTKKLYGDVVVTLRGNIILQMGRRRVFGGQESYSVAYMIDREDLEA